MSLPSDTSDYLQRAHQLIIAESAAVRTVLQTLDQKFIDVVQVLLACAGKVFIAGSGASGTIAKRAAHLFSVGGTPAVHLSPAAGLHAGLGVLRKGDVVIAISKGGASAELNEFCRRAHTLAGTLIVITAAPESELALMADQSRHQFGARGENCWNEWTNYSGFPLQDRIFQVLVQTALLAAHESLGGRTLSSETISANDEACSTTCLIVRCNCFRGSKACPCDSAVRTRSSFRKTCWRLVGSTFLPRTATGAATSRASWDRDWVRLAKFSRNASNHCSWATRLISSRSVTRVLAMSSSCSRRASSCMLRRLGPARCARKAPQMPRERSKLLMNRS
jgi:D-arabinose 5-phosphate isomerase GutQ